MFHVCKCVKFMGYCLLLLIYRDYMLSALVVTSIIYNVSVQGTKYAYSLYTVPYMNKE